MQSASRSAWVLPALLMVCLTAPAATINVPGDQPTIQAGINAAGTGDTVLVQPRTYPENLNFQGKAITLASLFHTTGDTSFILQIVIDGEDNDGIEEIITAPGPSPAFGAHIRGWNYDGGSLSAMSGIDFFAWQPSSALHGAWIFAGTDLDSNGKDDLVVGASPDPGVEGLVRSYLYDGVTMSLAFYFTAYPSDQKGGVCVAAGNF